MKINNKTVDINSVEVIEEEISYSMPTV